MRIEIIGEPNCSNTSSYRLEFPCAPYERKFDAQQITISAVYIILLFLGLPLNSYVIWVVTTIIRAGKDVHSRHLHLYILSLSAVDGMVMLTIPLLMSDILLREYLLGGFLCRIQFMVEVFHKIFSSFILTALSWDRFTAIRSPMSRVGRSPIWFARKVLIVSLLVVGVPACMILVYARIKVEGYETLHPKSMLLVNVTDVAKCRFLPGDWLDDKFGILTLTIGFAIPVTAITLFYTLAVFVLCKQIGGRVVSTISMGKVTRSVLMVVVFYYICWTPYWVIEVLVKVINWRPPAANNKLLSYMCHCLTIANSSINPVLYVLLNRELRNTYHTAATEQSRRSFAQDVPERSTLLPHGGSKRLSGSVEQDSSHIGKSKVSCNHDTDM